MFLTYKVGMLYKVCHTEERAWMNDDNMENLKGNIIKRHGSGSIYRTHASAIRVYLFGGRSTHLFKYGLIFIIIGIRVFIRIHILKSGDADKYEEENKQNDSDEACGDT